MATVELLIKSPNQQVADLQIPCDTTWSISKLKSYLYDVYPTKPLPNQQRIIYSGRLLPDHLLLEEILIKGLDVHIMHLVCPQSTNSPIATTIQPEAEQPKPVNEPILMPGADEVTPVVPEDGLRQRWAAPSNVFNMALYNQGFVPQTYIGSVPLPAPYMAYQMAALQQSYAQVMAQFLSQSQLIPPNVPSAAPMEIPGMSLGRSTTQAQNPQDISQPPVQPRHYRPQFDGQQQGDFYNTLNLLSRLLILCVILYFYSNPTKVMLVLCLGIFFFVYRSFTMASRRRDQVQVNPVADPDQPLDENVEDVLLGHLGPVNEPEENFTDQLENPELIDPQPTLEESQGSIPLRQSILNFPILTFIKTFFTSLIPEHPMPLDT